MTEADILERLWQEKNRLTPMKGTEALRLRSIAEGKLKPFEIHATTDQGRFFYFDGTTDTFIGPTVHLGNVGSEALMLGLNAIHERGCFPGDEVIRADQPDGIWRCIANRGTSLADWVKFSAAVGSSQLPHFEPVSNGDPTDPQIVFAGRDVVMVLKI